MRTDKDILSLAIAASGPGAERIERGVNRLLNYNALKRIGAAGKTALTSVGNGIFLSPASHGALRIPASVKEARRGGICAVPVDVLALGIDPELSRPSMTRSNPPTHPNELDLAVAFPIIEAPEKDLEMTYAGDDIFLVSGPKTYDNRVELAKAGFVWKGERKAYVGYGEIMALSVIAVPTIAQILSVSSEARDAISRLSGSKPIAIGYGGGIYRIVPRSNEARSFLRETGYNLGPSGRYETADTAEIQKLLTPDIVPVVHLSAGAQKALTTTTAKKPIQIKKIGDLYVAFGDTRTYWQDLLKPAGFFYASSSQYPVQTKFFEPILALSKRNGISSVIEFSQDILDEIELRMKAISMSRSADGTNCAALKSPPGMNYMPFQCVGIQWALERPKCLIADDMGLGKTVQALGLINNDESIKTVVVICPNIATNNWVREAKKWLTRPFNFYRAKNTGPAPADATFIVSNFEKLASRATDAWRLEIQPREVRALKEGWESLGEAADYDGVKNMIGSPTFKYYAGDKLRIITSKGTVCERFYVDNTGKFISTGVDKTALDKKTSAEKVGRSERESPFFLDLMNRKIDLLVIDEAHYIKNEEAKRTIAIRGEDGKGEGKWGTIEKNGLMQISRRILALTGTPIPNRVMEIWPLLSRLDPQQFGHRGMFGSRYTNKTKDRYGTKYEGGRNTEELQDKLRSSVMIRRLKSEVLKELPPKMRQVIELDPEEIGLSDDFFDEDREASDDMISAAEEIALQIANGDASWSDMVKFMQNREKVSLYTASARRKQIAIAKIPTIVETVIDWLETKQCLVVMCHHHEVSDQLKAALDKVLGPEGSVIYDGRTPERDRQNIIDRFQGVEAEKSPTGKAIPHDPKCRVFIGGIIACSTAVTLTRADTMVFAEIDWVPANIFQAEDRIHRIGQTASAFYQYLVVNGTLDAYIAKMIADKIEIADAVLDDNHATKEAVLKSVPFLRPPKTKNEQWSENIIKATSLSDPSVKKLNEWSRTFLEDVQKLLRLGSGLTDRQWNRAVATAFRLQGGRPKDLEGDAPTRIAANPVEDWAAAAILTLADNDPDRANQKNFVGFAATDGMVGHSLALMLETFDGELSDDQWRDAVRIATRYSRTQTPMTDEALAFLGKKREEIKIKKPKVREDVKQIIAEAVAEKAIPPMPEITQAPSEPAPPPRKAPPMPKAEKKPREEKMVPLVYSPAEDIDGPEPDWQTSEPVREITRKPQEPAREAPEPAVEEAVVGDYPTPPMKAADIKDMGFTQADIVKMTKMGILESVKWGWYRFMSDPSLDPEMNARLTGEPVQTPTPSPKKAPAKPVVIEEEEEDLPPPSPAKSASYPKGTLAASEIKAMGYSPSEINKMKKDGTIVSPSWGYYKFTKTPPAPKG